MPDPVVIPPEGFRSSTSDRGRAGGWQTLEEYEGDDPDGGTCFLDAAKYVGDESVTAEQEHFRLLSLAQRSETGERPFARVAFVAGDVEHHAESDGNGPVDASLKAIESKVGSGAEMMLYSVNAITSGSTESQGEVTVRLQLGGRVVNGVGADPDIVVASAKAYLSALNKLHGNADRVAAQG